MNFAGRAGRRSREYWTGQVSLADEADLQEEADLPFASSKSMRHTSCSRSTVSRSPRPRYLPRPDHARRTVPKWGAKRVSAQMRAEAEQHGRLIWEGTLVELQGMRRGAPSAQTNSFIAMPPSPTGVSASLSLSRSWLAPASCASTSAAPSAASAASPIMSCGGTGCGWAGEGEKGLKARARTRCSEVEAREAVAEGRGRRRVGGG